MPMGPSVLVVDHVAASPILVHVPHASRSVPAWARGTMTADAAQISRELDAMTDAHTDLIALAANDACSASASLFINQLSRLVVDPERFPDDREEMLQVGMGAVYTRGHEGAGLRSETDTNNQGELLTTVFEPYTQRFTKLVDQILERHQRAVIIDLHSFPKMALPYELHGSDPRPEICLGTDQFHTSPALLLAAEGAFHEHQTQINTPFSGSFVPLAHYQRDDRVQSIMIEVRRDQYLAQDLAPEPVGIRRVSQALADLIAAVEGADGGAAA
ncbi:MAG: N-formylglutamate amidohydrolase [Actinomycetia bacterium]|nr:N-formylglutamate amidohydrolase [Actinomycetes bacterium]